MKLIFKYMDKKEKGLAVVVFLLTFMQVFLDCSIPAQTKKISTLLQTEGTSINVVYSSGLVMLALALGAFTCAVLISYLIASVGTGIGTKIRFAIMNRIMEYSLPEMGEFGVGSLITRSTDDVTTIQTFINGCMKPLVQAPLMTILVISRISGIYSVWTILTIIVVAVIVALVIYIFAVAVPAVKGQFINRDMIVRESSEHISGIRVIHAYNAQEYQKKRFSKINIDMSDLAARSEKALATFMPVTVSMLYALTIGVYVSGAIHIGDVEASQRVALYGDMTAFVFYVALLITAILSVVQLVLMFPSTMNSMHRINEVLDKEASIKDKEGANDIPYAGGNIEFKDVCFKYPGSDESAIKNISFTANKGETIAIIGDTGCGKTSVLNLILRLYDVSEGSVLVDGKDVREYKLRDLRDRIGYVPQKSFLFEGKIRENIGYGENDRFMATIDEIIKAAQIGQADEFIKGKEGGYDAEITSGGTNLSGGQRQRMAISRAICRDPEIFIFDDSFSALDFKTDKELRRKLKEYAKGTTMIIVGQRISTVRDADKIIVMEKGCMVGIGTHAELMDSCKVYRDIALSQMSSEEAMA